MSKKSRILLMYILTNFIIWINNVLFSKTHECYLYSEGYLRIQSADTTEIYQNLTFLC
jgi:hypothetical protein